MRPLRYSINITLDGCCDHRAGATDEELHRYWTEKLALVAARDVDGRQRSFDRRARGE